MPKKMHKPPQAQRGSVAEPPSEAVHSLHAKSDGSSDNIRYRQTLRENFAQRLVILLRQRGLTQADLARKAGLERYHITDYVTARRYPRPGQLVTLAEALGVSVDDLRPQSPEAPPVLQKPTQFSMASDDRDPNKMRVHLDKVVSIETALKIGELIKEERDAAADGD